VFLIGSIFITSDNHARLRRAFENFNIILKSGTGSFTFRASTLTPNALHLFAHLVQFRIAAVQIINNASSFIGRILRITNSHLAWITSCQIHTIRLVPENIRFVASIVADGVLTLLQWTPFFCKNGPAIDGISLALLIWVVSFGSVAARSETTGIIH